MSDFLDTNDNEQPDFEWSCPVASSGSTSQCYIVQMGGKRSFMKKLRHEFSDNQSFRALFRKEYEKGISISHPNIVKYESWHDSTDDCYILMENIVGETLDSFIVHHPGYFASRVNLDKFFNQLLSALKCLHDNHVVYSDLKPQNIMLTQVNNDVKIIDLGFCYTDSYPDSAGTTKGFSAPEHLNHGKLDVATDVFGVGKIIEYIEKNSEKKLPSIYGKIKGKCLMEKQAHRWQSIDEILVKLNKRSNVWPKWVIAICCICVVGFISWQLIEKNTQISHTVIDVNNIKYSNFNSRDYTCHAIGQGPIKLANVYIRKSVDYDGEEYQVTAIANAAFKSLSHLKSVHIPHGITQIGKSAFFKCDSILVINIPNSVTEVGESAFYSCRGVRELNLSHNLKEIPTSGFVSTQISRLTIHEGVENIRMDAFAHCANIKNVKIPSSVKHIERGVFYNCVGLEKIELPKNLLQVDEYLFYGCDNLKHIYIHATEPPQALTLHRNPGQITLHVPAQSVEAYKAAPHWNEMTIVALD